jgi:hypothetical protein
MKRRNVKQNDRFSVNQEDDFVEGELDVDCGEVEEDEPELAWAFSDEEADDRAELDDGGDMPAEEVEPEMEDEDGFDIVAYYFRESACHKLLSPEHERALTVAVRHGHLARRRLGAADLDGSDSA